MIRLSSSLQPQATNGGVWAELSFSVLLYFDRVFFVSQRPCNINATLSRIVRVTSFEVFKLFLYW